MMYSNKNNNNIDGLSTSITDSPVTSPSFLSSGHFEFFHPDDLVTLKSSALNSNNNNIDDDDDKIDILQVYRDLLSNHHSHDNNNNSSVDNNVNNAGNTSELTIFNSIIDHDLHKEEEEVTEKENDQQQSVVMNKTESYCDDSVLSLSKDKLDTLDDSKSIQQAENKIQGEMSKIFVFPLNYCHCYFCFSHYIDLIPSIPVRML
ncbi:unnamed protein product [Trichobilharzia regenti]|nr:unnamed protein product [Trichobilharzia regenti]